MWKVIELPVTPYVGVWIETGVAGLISDTTWVTPYVGVWIETLFGWDDQKMSLSLLMWECGLKPPGTGEGEPQHTSLLMWECGLKHAHRNVYKPSLRHSLCGSVDWNNWGLIPFWTKDESLLMWECGLKHLTDCTTNTYLCHSLCGSVDWNGRDG